jgi:T-complex protein 1 subunit alpha
MSLQSQLLSLIDGQRDTGQDIRTQNVTACISLANIIKSSFGPTGLDKMLVDSIGDVTVSNDGAKILSMLEVEHPAAKVLVQLAELQDKEVGDGTTTVVILAAELLKVGNQLIKEKISPNAVISGYRVAMREACSFIKDTLSIPVDQLPRETLIGVAKTSMSSKIIGFESDFFSNLVVNAISKVGTVSNSGKPKYPINAVKVLKAPGGSCKESLLIEGFSLNCIIAADQMPKMVKNAKIALLDFDLSRTKLPHGMVVKAKAKDLTDIGNREIEILKERIEKVIQAGANVILTTKGMDDIACKFLVEAKVMGVRRVKKEDLKRIAKSTGGTIVLNFANAEGDETFEKENLGEAELVSQDRIADNELVIIRGTKTAKTSSIILRGPNSMMLDEMERSVHDALCATRDVLESKQVVPGGGSIETALSVHLEGFALSLGPEVQLPVSKYAEALMVIPKILCVNAALDATDLTAKLYTVQDTAQSSKEGINKEYLRYGLDLDGNCVRNNLEAGVLEPTMSKMKSIKFATEAAITILRIDEVIKLNPRPDPRGPEEE